MDFMLRYRGPLASNGTNREKHSIRTSLHSQLKELCGQQPLLEKALSEELPQGVHRGREVSVPRPLKIMFYQVPLGGFRFVPIIHRPHELACSLDILFLRREKAGAIIHHGGDIDNRLKTLLDGLRMPHETSELAGVTPDASDQRVYRLLEDDSLITRLSISTYQLFEPLDENEDPSCVELLMHVTIQSTYPMIANFGF
jgi:hypothetical protein